MNIYFINLDDKKYNQYKTYENAYDDAKKLIAISKKSKIEIMVENYCEFGHSDSCCKLCKLFEYINGNIIKNYD